MLMLKKEYFMNKKLLTAGMSLMEIMVAMGLAGVLSVGTMRIMSNMSKQQKTMETKSAEEALIYELQTSLRQKNHCEATFLGITPSTTGVAINNIYRFNDSATGTGYRTAIPNIAPNGVIGTGPGAIQIVSMRAISETTPPAVGNATQFNVTLEITLKSAANSNASFVRDHTRRIPLSMSRIISPASPTPNCMANNTGVLRSSCAFTCHTSLDSAIVAACTTLGGVVDIASAPWCRGLRIGSISQNDPPSTPAATIPDGIAMRITNNAHIVGGVTIGSTVPDDEFNVSDASDSGKLSVRTSLRVGSIGAIPTTAGTARFDNSIGVGTTPSATPGTGYFNTSIGVGTAPSATAGTGYFSTSIGVNTAPSTIGGTGSFSTSIGVGGDPSNFTGTGYFTRSIGIGIAPSTTAGTGYFNYSLGVGAEPPGASGQLRTTGNVGIAEAPDTGTTFALRVNGRIRSTLLATEIVADQQTVVTAGWVAQHVARAFATGLTGGMQADIASHILNMSPNASYNALRQAICQSTGGVMSGANCSLAAPLFEYQTSSGVRQMRIKIGTNGQYSSWFNQNACETSGNCVNLYARDRIEVTSAVGEIQSPKFCDSSGRCTTSHQGQICSYGYVMIGITPGGKIVCGYHQYGGSSSRTTPSGWVTRWN